MLQHYNTSSKSVAYSYTNTKMLEIIEASRTIEYLISHAFQALTSDAISGKCVLEKTLNKITVSVPYYLKEGSLNHNVINTIGLIASSSTLCPVELELIRLEAPYLDADVLAQYLSAELMANTFRKVIVQLIRLVGPLKNNSISIPMPGAILGVKVQLSGRLLLEPTRPRMTTQSMSLGSFTVLKNQQVQSSSFTTSNQKGAYTVKVWLCVKT